MVDNILYYNESTLQYEPKKADNMIYENADKVDYKATIKQLEEQITEMYEAIEFLFDVLHGSEMIKREAYGTSFKFKYGSMYTSTLKKSTSSEVF